MSTSTSELAYSEDGDPNGPPVFMSSSLGTSNAMWDANMDALKDFRVIRFDHLGHGDSPVPDGPYTVDQMTNNAIALMDRLGIERTSFVGLSMGGAIGMWLAINHPERVDRLVLMCTAAHFPTAQSWAERAATIRTEGAVQIADDAMERWFTKAFVQSHPDEVNRMRSMVASTPPEGYAASCEALGAFDVRDQLGRISAPTLAIAGDHDQGTTPDALRFIANSIPGARLEIVENAAHIANIEQADVVNKLLVEHLSAK